MTNDTGREAGPADDAARRTARGLRKRWTRADEEIFFAELAATANVTYAAGKAGMSTTGAYMRKRRDPPFAARWLQALEQGYAELELQLLRHSRDGAERTETVRDGANVVKQVRTVHSYPHHLAMRMLMQHRSEVERFRLMERGRAADDPALADKVRAEMARVRARLDEEDGAE